MGEVSGVGGAHWPRPGTGRAGTGGVEERRLARYGRAWRGALGLARRLVDEFGAVRVVAYGPLVHPERFGPGDRVQLAVWGLRAVVFPGEAGGLLDPPALVVDADHLDAATARLVQREGVELARHHDPQG